MQHNNLGAVCKGLNIPFRIWEGINLTSTKQHLYSRAMTPKQRLQLLREAVLLEQAGGTWTQKHVSAVTGYSVSFLRASDCPKSYEEGNGPHGKDRVCYQPAEVRDWRSKRLRKAS